MVIIFAIHPVTIVMGSFALLGFAVISELREIQRGA
jgi:hypothetical protein